MPKISARFSNIKDANWARGAFFGKARTEIKTIDGKVIYEVKGKPKNCKPGIVFKEEMPKEKERHSILERLNPIWK